MIEFRTQQFEGPLELLLSLIDEKRLGITDVALAEVTGQYLHYIKEHRSEIDLDNLAGFLSLAARLILMKSKALLPFLVLEKDEEDEVENLTGQLEEYKKFSQAAQRLGVVWGVGRQSFTRSVPPRKRQIIFMPPKIAIDDFATLFRGVLSDIPKVDQLDQKRMQDVVALEERIMTLARSLKERGTIAFSQFIKDARNRSDVIVSFLALLELVKQNTVTIQQETIAEDIVVTSCRTES